MRLRSRLLLITLLPPLLGLLAFGASLILVFQQQQQQQSLEHQTQILNSYARLLDHASDKPQRERILYQLLGQPGIEGAGLYYLNGVPVAQQQPLLLERPSWRGRFEQKSVILPHHAKERPLQLRILFSNQSNQLLLYRLWATFALLLLAVFIIAACVSLRFTFSVTDPLLKLIEAAKRLQEGLFEPLPKSQAKGELKLLENELDMARLVVKERIDTLEEAGDIAHLDMRLSLEALEIQNVELDLARKETVQSSHLKNQFFNSMNHEIRTALNSIMGFSRLLARTSLDEEQREQLHALQQSANNLLNIVNNILDHSRLEESKFRTSSESFCLRFMIEDLQDTMSPLAHEKDIEQVSLMDKQLPTQYVADTLRLRQILANMISNAIKYSDSGDVQVRAMLESRLHERTALCLAVSDNGPGLTPEQQLQLFKPFSQGAGSPSKLQGSGLGLSICKRLVEEMGGQIGVDSTPGKGSTFWIKINLVADLIARDPYATSLKDQSIWLLEDHELLKVALHQQLAGCAAQLHELPDTPNLHNELPNFQQGDIYLIDVEHHGSVDLRALLKRLESLGQPCLLLARYPEPTKLHLGPLPDYFAVVAKPASQKMLRDELLQLAGTQLERLPPRDVMVVDDHDGNRKLACLMLKDMNMNARAYASAEEALDAFEMQRPDLILMDIFMPEMDGKECTRRMRLLENADEHTPIHALTAELEKMEEFRLLEAGLDGYLTKPLDDKALFRLLVTLPAGIHAESLPVDHDIILSHDARPVPASLPSSPQAQGLPIFDEPLALKRCGGRVDAAREMQSMLVSGLNHDTAQLGRLSQTGDLSGLLEVVHKLHGGTRYCGVPRLEKAAGELERSLKQEVPEELIAQRLETLLTEIMAVQDAEAINAFISRTA